jgi:hypothetical protein
VFWLHGRGSEPIAGTLMYEPTVGLLITPLGEYTNPLLVTVKNVETVRLLYSLVPIKTPQNEWEHKEFPYPDNWS